MYDPDKISQPGYMKAKMENATRTLAACAKSRGLKMEVYCHGFYSKTGVEFKDRAGRYASLSQYILKEIEPDKWGNRDTTPAKLLDTLAEQGLDVRLSRDLKPSKRQLAFQF